LGLEGDRAAEQPTGAVGGLSASPWTGEADRRCDSGLRRVEQGDEELIVALRDAEEQAVDGPCTQVDLGRHRAGVQALAETALGALDALRVDFSELHSLTCHLVFSVMRGFVSSTGK